MAENESGYVEYLLHHYENETNKIDSSSWQKIST